MSPLVLRLALLSGLVAAGLSATSIIAWKFGFDPALGEPLAWRFYRPWAAVGWWEAWGHAEPYRRPFLSGLSLVAFVLILPMMAVRLLQMYGPLHLKQNREAGLGQPGDLHKSGHIKTRGPGVVLGRAKAWWGGWRIYRSRTDSHALVLGMAGSGKTTTAGITTALLEPGSMLIIDPSGSIAAATARHRRTLGPFHLFDPTKRDTARCNPVLEIREGDAAIGDCQMYAAMLVNSPKGQGPKDPFWEQSAGYLVSGLLHQVRHSDDPSLGHMWRLLQEIDAGKYPKRGLTSFANAVIRGVEKREPRVRDSMVTTAVTNLQFLADPIIQHAVSGADFRAGDLQAADTPVTIAVSIPEDQADRLRPLTRVMLQAMIKPLMSSVHHVGDGRRKRRGALIEIDDFPALHFMEVIELGLADARKYRLRFLLLAQGIEQIEKHYGEKQAITGNCGTWAIVPGLSERTMNAAVKVAGKHAIAQASKQHGLSLRGNSSMSESEAMREVLNSREMLMRAKDELLIFTAGCYPTWLRKIRCWEDPAFRDLIDTSKPDDAPAQLPVTTATITKEMPPWLLTHHS